MLLIFFRGGGIFKQPRSQGFSPNIEGKSPGNEVDFQADSEANQDGMISVTKR